MTLRRRSIWLWLAAIPYLAGCAVVDPAPDFDEAARHIQVATGQEVVTHSGDGGAIRERVSALLENGVSAAEAVEISLLNNPGLQAAFLRIGVARADLVQAGLLSNPSFSSVLRLPSGGGLANLELGLTQSLVDLWQLPIRKRAARNELQREIFEISHMASQLAARTKGAYFAAVAAQRAMGAAAENLQTARELLELALMRQEAGAGNEIDVNAARSEVLENELVHQEARLEVYEAKRRMVTLLGLATAPDELTVADELPEPSRWSLTLEDLVEAAKKNRLDVQAAQHVVHAAEARLQEQKRSVWQSVSAGVELERESRKAGEDDTEVIGPSLSFDLPIFDQNQAQIARTRFEYERSQKLLDELLLGVVQETRGAFKRAETAIAAARFYRERLLPLREQSLELAREAYRLGQTSFLSVLQAERVFLKTRRDHVDALKRSAVSLSELEGVTAQPLDRILSPDEGDQLDEEETEKGDER